MTRTAKWRETFYLAWGMCGLAYFMAVVMFGHRWPTWIQIGAVAVVGSWYAFERFRTPHPEQRRRKL